MPQDIGMWTSMQWNVSSRLVPWSRSVQPKDETPMSLQKKKEGNLGLPILLVNSSDFEKDFARILQVSEKFPDEMCVSGQVA